MTDKTSIAILKETRKQLAEIGSKEETFDEIIRKLLDNWRNDN